MHPCGGSSNQRLIRQSRGRATGRKVLLLSVTITSQKNRIKSSPELLPVPLEQRCSRRGFTLSRTGPVAGKGPVGPVWDREPSWGIPGGVAGWSPGNQESDEQNPPSLLSATPEKRRQSDLIKKLPLLHSVPAGSHKPSTTAI